MKFYCPVCRQTYDLAPETTLTTKLNQQAYKAHCPTCQQDMSAYGSQEVKSTVAPEADTNTDAQAAVDQALKEFGETD